MNLLSWLLMLTLSLLALYSVSGERILILTPLGSRSHKIFFLGIAGALAKKGHQVTLVSSVYEPQRRIKNIREVVITKYDVDSLVSFGDTADIVQNVILNTPSKCSETLSQQEVQRLKNEAYDVVLLSVFLSHCYLSFVHHFQVPYIYVSPAGLVPPFTNMLNNIDFPSIVPNKFLASTFPLSFMDRLQSTLVRTLFSIVHDCYLVPQMESICKEREFCPPDIVLSDIMNNGSLAIVNSVRTLESPPRPVMPNIIYAGGAHIKPPKDLPEDLEEFVAGSGEDGFIFFSLGFALKPSLLPEEYRKILIKVFESLKQRIIWKWEEKTMRDLPENVMIKEWVPQRDILGHPKLKLFITHGGYLSAQETTYHGVPIIGMPIFGDQFANAYEAEKDGWGRVMEWKNLEENSFRNLIQDVLSDKRILEIAKQRSEIMHDRLIPPDEEAAFWVEYVMRHKGAPHIKSPIGMMKWYEIYNIDVWSFVIAVILGVCYLLYRLVKCIICLCSGASKTKTKRKQN